MCAYGTGENRAIGDVCREYRSPSRKHQCVSWLKPTCNSGKNSWCTSSKSALEGSNEPWQTASRLDRNTMDDQEWQFRSEPVELSRTWGAW